MRILPDRIPQRIAAGDAGAAIHTPPTSRMMDCLRAIKALTASKGYPPSVREIGKYIGLSSSSTVHHYLEALRDAHLINWNPRFVRTLTVTDTGNRLLGVY